jgi:hypothetical protein
VESLKLAFTLVNQAPTDPPSPSLEGNSVQLQEKRLYLPPHHEGISTTPRTQLIATYTQFLPLRHAALQFNGVRGHDKSHTVLLHSTTTTYL